MGRQKRHRSNSISTLLQQALCPLARLMIRSGKSAAELIEIVKLSYVQAAISEVMPVDSRVNISSIAVVTGLTRKEVSALLRRKSERERRPSGRRALQQRALRVLRGWTSDPQFHGSRGRRRTLPLHGEEVSFSTLVKRYGGDVTPASVLRELERVRAVVVTRSGNVRVRPGTVDPAAHTAGQMAEFTRLLRDFTNTVQPISSAGQSPRFFAFRDTTIPSASQVALFHRTFSRRAASLVEGIQQWAAHQKKTKGHIRGKGNVTHVGVGVYLTQSED